MTKNNTKNCECKNCSTVNDSKREQHHQCDKKGCDK